jgi:hypothetical protein
MPSSILSFTIRDNINVRFYNVILEELPLYLVKKISLPPVKLYGHFRVGKNSSPDPILSQINSVRIPTPYFFNTHFNIVHPTSYTMGTGSSFPGVKQPGREADHSPPASAEVKKIWIYTSTPPYAFMA